MVRTLKAENRQQGRLPSQQDGGAPLTRFDEDEFGSPVDPRELEAQKRAAWRRARCVWRHEYPLMRSCWSRGGVRGGQKKGGGIKINRLKQLPKEKEGKKTEKKKMKVDWTKYILLTDKGKRCVWGCEGGEGGGGAGA